MPCKMARSPSDRKVYIGELSRDVRRKELEEICGEYGRVRDCWVARNPPGFAFVEFEDARDAADTVRELNGRKICGKRVNVKLYTEKMSGKGGAGRPPNSDEKCYECRLSGHYARDCRSRQNRPRRNRSYSRDRSPSYRRSRSRSSPSKYSRSTKKRYSRSRSHDREYYRSRPSPDRYRRKETPRRRSPSKSPRRSPSYSDRRSYPSLSERRPARPRSPDASRSKSSSRTRGRRSRSPTSTKHNRSGSPNDRYYRSSSLVASRKRATTPRD